MTKIEEFKTFVKENPTLITHVKDNKMTWQKFYEIYDLYGKDDDVWKEYLTIKEEPKTTKKESSFNELLNMAKKIDIDKVQDGISSLQKAFGLFGDLFVKNNDTTTNSASSTYRPRPLYRTFED